MNIVGTGGCGLGELPVELGRRNDTAHQTLIVTKQLKNSNLDGQPGKLTRDRADTHTETHGCEKGNTPNEAVPSKAQVSGSRAVTLVCIHVPQGGIVMYLFALIVAVGLGKVDTVVGSWDSVLRDSQGQSSRQ